MKISIIGTGYVGLVSGVCLSEKGHDIICVDIDADKVEKINAGQAPIYEDGLSELLQRNIGKRLTATTDLAAAIAETTLTMIAVGTPFDGSAIDLRFIEEVSRAIGAALKDKNDFHAVVVKSTVVPGTTDDVVLPILERESGKQIGKDIGLSMNPEFLREGVAISDFMQPDRIVYGGTDEQTLAALDELYSVFPDVDKIRTTNKTAEMIKYTANSLLATMISFSNEIANLCSTLADIDVKKVMQGVHLDHRLSPIMDNGERVVPTITTFLEAGCGFGGSCFPKDVKALISHGEAAGQDMQLLQSVIRINQAQPLRIMDLLHQGLDSLQGRRVAILGLAFKPGTDDMRESPAVPIIRALHEEGAEIVAYDPIAIDEARKVLADIPVTFVASLAEVLEAADAVVLVTAWDEFLGLPGLVNAMDKPPVVVDGRRMIDKTSVPHYFGIGLSESQRVGG